MNTASEIPFIDLGGEGPDLHFAHANGFPAETYRNLLERLSGACHVLGMNQRPLWPGFRPGDIRSWNDLVDDLIGFLDARTKPPVVGVGHSLGGVLTALASVRRPDLFCATVLIDPVFLPLTMMPVWWLLKLSRLARLLPLVQAAKKRRRVWESREAVLKRYREVPAFRTFHPGVLEDYVEHGFVPDAGGGVRLRYPPEWEAWVFEQTPHDQWRLLSRIPPPCLVMRGETSDTFRPAVLARMRRVFPEARYVEIPGAGHFAPLEKPPAVAREILAFLDDLPRGSRRS